MKDNRSLLSVWAGAFSGEYPDGLPRLALWGSVTLTGVSIICLAAFLLMRKIGSWIYICNF